MLFYLILILIIIYLLYKFQVILLVRMIIYRDLNEIYIQMDKIFDSDKQGEVKFFNQGLTLKNSKKHPCYNLADNVLNSIELKDNYVILDLPTGTGALSQYALLNNYKGNFIGIDLSQETVNLANKFIIKYPKFKKRLKFIVDDCTNLKKIEDNSIDVVFTIGLNGDINENILKRYFKEVNRILKKGGKLISQEFYLKKNPNTFLSKISKWWINNIFFLNLHHYNKFINFSKPLKLISKKDNQNNTLKPFLNKNIWKYNISLLFKIYFETCRIAGLKLINENYWGESLFVFEK